MNRPAPINTLDHTEYSPASGFLASCKRYPDNPALVVNDVSYSYSMLSARVQHIYEKLSVSKRAERIAIWCDDGVFPYSAILAVSLYGACYVPLNSKFPYEHNLSCLKLSGAQLLLSNKPLPEFEEAGITLIQCNEEISSSSVFSPEPIVRQSLCYILFTSGSTGSPKGVPINRFNLRAFFRYFNDEYDFNASDGFLQPYEFTFDVSVFSMFMPWQYGACCYDVDKKGIRYLAIIDKMQKYPVTVASMVPGTLKFMEKYMAELNLPKLRYSFFREIHCCIRWR
jgi:D-alanine--poly(phosphoribitol) ligase subunit 1